MERSSHWAKVQHHYDTVVKHHHLRDLLKDDARNEALKIHWNNILFDFTHEKVDKETIHLLDRLAQDLNLEGRIKAMFSGEKINQTENRAVLHVACRAKETDVINVDGQNVIPEVHKILGRIEKYSHAVRHGERKGFTGKNLTNVLVIGIGGSYLGIEFVYEALRCHPDALESAKGRKLRFLANVDPIDFARATEGLNPEETLVVINSKTFTTAETMLNARTVRHWILEHYKQTGHNVTEHERKIVDSHVCAVSTNLAETSKFGISDESVFGFWDWVGGRYSVCSAIGVLPLSLHFGFDIMRKFLEGARSVDEHFHTTKDFTKNVPVMLALLGFYHSTIQNYSARALLPYCQALSKFAPHIQQLDMESNGKRVSLSGEVLNYECTVVNFGEPGTNGQHSFYQLLHQGRAIPCEFIGFCKSQTPVHLHGEPVSNHDELMSNFFSQPDALALGKTVDELKAENVPEKLLTHKTFPGDRPSLQILFTELNAYTCGQLLAIYEHRTAVEGFIWDVNSFDQWGVELGKVLAKNVRDVFKKGAESIPSANLNSATKFQLTLYEQLKK